MCSTINIKDFSRREILCIRSDSNVYGSGGDYQGILEPGCTYTLVGMVVYAYYTLVTLDEFPGCPFNSVLFSEKD